MELYNDTAAALSQLLTRRYSSSFSSASRLFPPAIQRHVYNIYGLVRIADEVVDTYDGSGQAELLKVLEEDCYAAIKRGYSTNPIVHAFADTARGLSIGSDLIEPFFASMRMDLRPLQYTRRRYDSYIFGSAEVIGLMCLRVFCAGDPAAYARLEPGARRLGAAFQKVNFLRDLADDYQQLGRFYFPGSTFDSFDEAAKQTVADEIRQDFLAAAPYVQALPKTVRPAVATSYRYYEKLLSKLEQTPIAEIKDHRIRLPAYQKALLLATESIRARL